MRRGFLLLVLLVAGCPSGNGEIGDRCDGTGDCSSSLQCLDKTCVPRCQRAPDCGDGYACDTSGICQLATGELGDACTSEVQCAPGLSCQIDGTAVDASQRLEASCIQAGDGSPAASACDVDSDCTNGTCALGLCVDLCADTRDCTADQSCVLVPRIAANGALFGGCLPSHGSLAWTIPVAGPNQSLLVPVPDVARSITMTLSVDDLDQKVGVTSITSPGGSILYTAPCPTCDPEDAYFKNPVRHLPDFGQSELQMPSSPDTPLEVGAYAVTVSSLRPDNSPGSAIPHVTAVVKLDTSVILDLHFHFLDLDDHPCAASFGVGGALNATIAQTGQSLFQLPPEGVGEKSYLGWLKANFADYEIALGTLTYDDITDHPDLDGLDIADAPSLFALSTYPVGINIYFVRTLSPIGLQAFGPNPGPAGLAGNRLSGIAIGVDTLCYRSWEQLARLTTHEIARYMGLYHNVEAQFATHSDWVDPISDSNMTSDDLMYYSESSSTTLSPEQQDILQRSAVLR